MDELNETGLVGVLMQTSKDPLKPGSACYKALAALLPEKHVINPLRGPFKDGPDVFIAKGDLGKINFPPEIISTLCVIYCERKRVFRKLQFIRGANGEVQVKKGEILTRDFLKEHLRLRVEAWEQEDREPEPWEDDEDVED